MTRGPSVSIWFLRHFGCSTKNESIIGDLVEQYQQGRSRVWYWRQVFIAISLLLGSGLLSPSSSDSRMQEKQTAI